MIRDLLRRSEAAAEMEVEVGVSDDVPAGSDLDQPALGAYCIPTPDSTCWPSKDAWKDELIDMLSVNATTVLPYHVGYSQSNVMRNAQMASYPATIVNVMTAEDVQVRNKTWCSVGTFLDFHERSPHHLRSCIITASARTRSRPINQFQRP